MQRKKFSPNMFRNVLRSYKKKNKKKLEEKLYAKTLSIIQLSLIKFNE